MPMRVFTAALLVVLLGLTSPIHAGDIAAGRKKALQCQTCHGLDGLSKLPEAPHIAGQVEQYLVKAMMDYKDGHRKNDMMSLIVPMLSEADIADLAAYYASLNFVKP